MECYHPLFIILITQTNINGPTTFNRFHKFMSNTIKQNLNSQIFGIWRIIFSFVFHAYDQIKNFSFDLIGKQELPIEEIIP